jgi:opacity protein-like surface antigen
VDGTGFKGDLGTSALVEFGAGYQLPNNFRADLTVGIRPNERIRSNENVFGLPVTAKADLATWTVLANIYYDIATGTPLTPYVGAAIGFAVHDLGKVNYGFAGATATETGRTVFSPAWAVGAGSSYDINSDIKVDVGYRYLDAGRFETGGVTDGGQIQTSKGKVEAHELKIGFRYRF